MWFPISPFRQKSADAAEKDLSTVCSSLQEGDPLYVNTKTGVLQKGRKGAWRFIEWLRMKWNGFEKCTEKETAYIALEVLKCPNLKGKFLEAGRAVLKNRIKDPRVGEIFQKAIGLSSIPSRSESLKDEAMEELGDLFGKKGSFHDDYIKIYQKMEIPATLISAWAAGSNGEKTEELVLFVIDQVIREILKKHDEYPDRSKVYREEAGEILTELIEDFNEEVLKGEEVDQVQVGEFSVPNDYRFLNFLASRLMETVDQYMVQRPGDYHTDMD